MRWWLAVLGLAMAIPAAAQDVDRDGISDQLEQQLLDRFAPTLLLARGECDSAPASFEPFRSEPLVRAKDGTLYGQGAGRHRALLLPEPVLPGEHGRLPEVGVGAVPARAETRRA